MNDAISPIIFVTHLYGYINILVLYEKVGGRATNVGKKNVNQQVVSSLSLNKGKYHVKRRVFTATVNSNVIVSLIMSFGL